MATSANSKSSVDDEDAFVFIYDRRSQDSPEKRLNTGGLFSFADFKERVCTLFGIKKNEKFVIATTNREEISDDDSWDIVDKGDTLYVLNSLEQELCAPAQERVNYLPHYDTIVKGGMYEYYASEGQNPLPYAFAELIDNALTATANNDGPRNIEIRMHFEESSIYVIDNGKGMTPRQLNNWAIYRLSKFIRKDKRSKVNLDETVEEEESFIKHDLPKSLNSDISYFGVGGKQAVFFIGNSTRMITRHKGSKDVHELSISKDEFEQKEKNHESIYSGYIRNRKAGDASHINKDDEGLRKIIEEETDKDSFTLVVIQGISKEHLTYLKEKLKEWTTQLAHIYHYYLHGPGGNVDPEENQESGRALSPFRNIDIQISIWLSRSQTTPRVISLRDIEDDMQTNFVRNSVSSFEFVTVVEGAKVEGVLRYHPFLYDRETYPLDMYIKVEPNFEDEHDYAISDSPARGRRPIFECFWNGRLIPYTTIDSFEWCATPKKAKNVPIQCYNRVSGVLWTDDMFQVSTNKLTFIDLELKLRDKQATFSRVVNGQEKRTGIEREFQNWLRECHEEHDKQIHFTNYQGLVVRSDLPKNKQTPWACYKQVEWDGKIYKAGMLVRIQRTLPMLMGTISRILLHGDHTGDVFATGGDLEILQEPKSLYNHEVKIVPLSKLDRFVHPTVLKRAIEEEEGKLPSDIVLTWPDGNEVTNNAKRRAGETIGAMKVEIINKKGDKMSKMPGKDQAQKKLLVELKVIWQSPIGDQIIVSHVCQHGKTWPFWFRKMENIKNIGSHVIQLQVVLNESGENMYAGKPLPFKKINFQVTEAAPEKFSVGLLTGPFRIGVPFNIPLDLQDGFGNPAKAVDQLSVKLESNGLDLTFSGTQVKGHKLTIKDVVASGTCQTHTGKNFTLAITIPELKEKQDLKIRLLPGPAASLVVNPEEEMVLENRKAPEFKVQVLDMAGNHTSLEGKQCVVCKLSGSAGLPSYSSECSGTGSGVLTGEPIIVKKMKAQLVLTAKIEIQGCKSAPSVERKIKLVPSGNITEIQLSYEEENSRKPVIIHSGQEVAQKAGETLSTLKIKLFDEADREIPMDDKIAGKIKVNWIAKVPKDLLLKGQLPPVKSPTSLFEHKYLQVTIADGSGVDLGFVLKSLPGEPFQIRCTCVGSNSFKKGEKLQGEINVKVKDKFGNDVGFESEKVCKQIKVSGEGLKEKELAITMDKKVITVTGVNFEDDKLGRKELQHMKVITVTGVNFEDNKLGHKELQNMKVITVTGVNFEDDKLGHKELQHMKVITLTGVNFEDDKLGRKELQHMKVITVTGVNFEDDKLGRKELQHMKVITVTGVNFEDDKLGRKELQVTWNNFKDYVRLEMVAGPLKKLAMVNYDPDEAVTVYTESKLPYALTVQLQDEWGNPVKTPDVKLQLAVGRLRLIPKIPPVKTNKDGMAEFGMFTVASQAGDYTIQPKAIVGNNQTIMGPSYNVHVRADPSRPTSIYFKYNNKHTFVAGEPMTEFIVKVYAEDNSLLSNALASNMSLKLWKSEGTNDNSLPSRTVSYSPETNKKSEPGVYTFKDLKNPEEAGPYKIMFVYYDGNHQLFSNVIHIKVEPAAPVKIVALDPVETATVSNTRPINTRCVIKYLRLQLKDKFDNPVTRGMNGSMAIKITSGTKDKHVLPLFTGKSETVMLTLAGGMCTITNLALAENSPGKDGCEYFLVFEIHCKNVVDTKSIKQFKIPFLFYDDAKKQSEMATLSKERDNLLGAIKTYKSLFETTEQLIEELKISVKEAKAEEQKVKDELKRNKLDMSKVTKVEIVEKMLVDFNIKKEESLNQKRRLCALPTVLPNDNDVLGKIGHLALVGDNDAARVLSWHMSSDMDCVVTMTTKKAKEIYHQTNGKQQVLPLDSIFRKTLTDWVKPLPHVKYKPNWRPPGNPMYARNLISFDKNAEKCQTVFAMLLGDTLWIDSLDTANDYRKELVKFTNCPTILTREGDRIRSNGKFGGLMNKAPPVEKLRGVIFGSPVPSEVKQYSWTIGNNGKFGGLMNKAPPVEKLRGVIFGSPVPSEVKQYSWTIDTLQNLKAAMLANKTAQEELEDQLAVINTPEMQTKYDECREVENQLKELEKKLGVNTPQRSQTVKRAQDGYGDGPANKKVRQSPVTRDLKDENINGNASNLSTPTRISRRIAALTPGSSDSENRKRFKKS